MNSDLIGAIITTAFGSAVTLIGLLIGFRQFSKEYALKEREVKAEAQNDSAQATTTVWALYEGMLQTRMSQDKALIEMNAEVTRLKVRLETLEAANKIEKERGDKFEQMAKNLQQQLDDEREKRLRVQDERDEIRREISSVRRELNDYKTWYYNQQKSSAGATALVPKPPGIGDTGAIPNDVAFAAVNSVESTPPPTEENPQGANPS